jgi:predicted transcriptional regulator
MARCSDSAVVLLSIHPRFVLSILAGRKKVEFRRTGFRRTVEFAVVYATSPISKVVGYLKIGSVIEGTPSSLWRRFGQVGGISRAGFREYYAGRETGIALEISQVRALREAIPLRGINRTGRGPQSFEYLSPKQFERVCEARRKQRAIRKRGPLRGKRTPNPR